MTFCRRHRSHFCPCVYPTLYRENPGEPVRAWDDPELAAKLYGGRDGLMRARHGQAIADAREHKEGHE